MAFLKVIYWRHLLAALETIGLHLLVQGRLTTVNTERALGE